MKLILTCGLYTLQKNSINIIGRFGGDIDTTDNKTPATFLVDNRFAEGQFDEGRKRSEDVIIDRVYSFNQFNRHAGVLE